MRISDWSSDVCSSDLLVEIKQLGRQRAIAARFSRHRLGAVLVIIGDRLETRGGGGGGADLADDEVIVAQDRKSVVEGRSVSVRVDHGGRRIIKKQKRIKHEKDSID